MPTVAINGLGRIGRAALKILLDSDGLELAAVNDIAAADNLAYLINYDTVYGRYHRKVSAEDGALVVDDRRIPVLTERDPGALPWGDLGVDLVLECTGVFSTEQDLSKHDSPSRSFRRGRAAAANLVPASTGAARATTRALPELTGRFDGVAVRAPIPVGSIADIVLVASQPTTAEEVNDAFRREAATDRYQEVLGVSDDPLVSADIVGDPRAAVVDLELTTVVDGTLVKVMAWYDNEWGFTHQMIREARTTLADPAPVPLR